MSERDTRTNQDIRIPTLGGLNERPSPANLRPGEFSHLEGLYPAQIGLLRRIPGKVYLAGVNGRVLQIYATGNANGDVLVQTDAPARYVFTLDELRARATTPNLTYPTLSEEETMSMAIIVQMESNAQDGGSAQGFLTGTDSSSVISTFYPRRLTNMLVNESSTVVSFTASTGGAGAASTPANFVLGPGSYRLSYSGLHYSAAAASIVAGLYNVTDSAFEVFSGGTTPVLSTPAIFASGTAANLRATFEAAITVTGSNKMFSIKHECNVQAVARALTFCGNAYPATTANVNGAAAKEFFAFLKILKTA